MKWYPVQLNDRSTTSAKKLNAFEHQSYEGKI